MQTETEVAFDDLNKGDAITVYFKEPIRGDMSLSGVFRGFAAHEHLRTMTLAGWNAALDCPKVSMIRTSSIERVCRKGASDGE